MVRMAQNGVLREGGNEYYKDHDQRASDTLSGGTVEYRQLQSTRHPFLPAWPAITEVVLDSHCAGSDVLQHDFW